MSNIFDLIWKDDPLKTASDSLEQSNFGSAGGDIEVPINISLLFVASLFLAISKSLYGPAGYSLIQHLVASAILVFVAYVGIGIAFIAVGLPYVWVNNRLRCFLTCFIAALIASMLFFYLSGFFIDVGIAVFDPLPISEWWKNRLPNLFPPLFFSIAGCFAIYLSKRTSWVTFLIYGLFTWVFLYFTAFDREAFFSTVMKPLSKIVVF